MAQHERDEDGAARWAILLDARELDLHEHAEFAEWLAADPNHDGALLRAQATLSYLDRGRALAGNNSGESPARAGMWFSRRRLLQTGLASGAAAAAAALFAFLPRSRTIGTGVGELRRVPLADGSVATLNTSSKVAVEMADRRRTIRLDGGEAWFRVAPDKNRPFVVEAGDVRVQAVGTAFAVRRRDSGADVLVTEGIVDTWVVGHETDRRRISAGSKGFVSDARPNIEVAVAPQEIDRALAWRSGELALDGETLAYAVEEINRYNVRKLVIADPALADAQLVGYFRTTEPENFGRAVAAMTGARVIDEGDTIRLVKAAS